jgi:hypothetical protein
MLICIAVLAAHTGIYGAIGRSFTAGLATNFAELKRIAAKSRRSSWRSYWRLGRNECGYGLLFLVEYTAGLTDIITGSY